MTFVRWHYRGGTYVRSHYRRHRRGPGAAQASLLSATLIPAARPAADHRGRWHTASTLLPSGSRTNAP